MKKLLILIFVFTAVVASAQKRYNGGSDVNRKSTGICVTIGGVAFTTAAILEGGYSYGTNVTTSPATPTSSAKVSYVIPPVWRQTPRNIMFVAGVGLTITGLITAISSR